MRKLTDYEIQLVTKLLELGGRHEELPRLVVYPMEDGGMGSLRIGQPYDERRFGGTIAEVRFEDQDGTLVSAVLNVDAHQGLYEVDIDVRKVLCAPAIANCFRAA